MNEIRESREKKIAENGANAKTMRMKKIYEANEVDSRGFEKTGE